MTVGYPSLRELAAWISCTPVSILRILALLLMSVGSPRPGSAQATTAPILSEATRQFQTVWQEAEQALEIRDYERAAQRYEQVVTLLNTEPVSWHRLARCRAMLSQREEAFAALAKAVEFGWEDSEALTGDEMLGNLREDPRFDVLVRAADDIRRETCVLYAGKTVQPRTASPLLVLLHGLGGGPRLEVPLWKSVADELGLVIAAPRGVTRIGPISHGWHQAGAAKSNQLNAAACRQAVAKAVATASEQYNIDRSRIVLVGFSQGGLVALHTLHDDPEGYCGALAICTVYVAPQPSRWKQPAPPARLRVFIVAGALDGLVGQSRRAREEISAAGIEVDYEEIANMGHEPPPDYPARQRRALKALLARP